MSKPRDVDSYIAHSAVEARPILDELRAIFRSTFPDVEEKISWAVPFYRFHGAALGGYAVYASHVSFGCADVLPATDREALEKKGYKTGKKTIRIEFDQEVPATAIEKILRAQAKINEAKQ